MQSPNCGIGLAVMGKIWSSTGLVQALKHPRCVMLMVKAEKRWIREFSKRVTKL